MKLVNDPVYGLIQIRTPLIFDLIEHPLFQRLRRIKQTGLTHLTYPGAIHTRFHHALGAMHLMCLAVDELRSKRIAISPEEEEAVLLAILMHDIGHGPYSHALERLIIRAGHEQIGIRLMEHLADELGDPVRLAMAMFQDTYHRPFFHQLISGQLDLDRLDYLSRDSFYTGVAEGVIGHDRILRMLQVVDDRLVIEEKGLYSIEKFLVARRIMYWQVYLHKTSIAAEGMARQVIHQLRKLDPAARAGYLAPEFEFFLAHEINASHLAPEHAEAYGHLLRLDDVSIDYSLKQLQDHPVRIIRMLATGLVQRHLHKVQWVTQLAPGVTAETLRAKCREQYHLTEEEAEALVWTGSETNTEYLPDQDEIMILSKNGNIRPFSSFLEAPLRLSRALKHFICHPKLDA